MAELNLEPDIEPQEAALEQMQPVAKGNSGRKSFSKLRRELSDDELSSPAVQRMLIDEIERLDADRVELISFRGKFHDSDKKVAVLDEKFKAKISIEIIHIGCITVGAAMLGYAPTIWATQQSTAIMGIVFGLVLIIAALVAKAVKP
ncbi:hypothetical protein [Aeromonas allosaccharophila]|uniref:hypothetical protein n=1 Tax=Aeromonas allosaccharophila TaxID=656 RepID=UPI003D25683A